VLRGGDFDRWDLEVPGGLFGSRRVLMAVEEHGGGRQLVRFRCWSRPAPIALVFVMLFAAAAMAADFRNARAAAGFLGALTLFLAFQVVLQCGAAMAAADSAFGQLSSETVGRESRPAAWAQLRPRPIRASGLGLDGLLKGAAGGSTSADGDD
jgi:hypothetical protein